MNPERENNGMKHNKRGAADIDAILGWLVALVIVVGVIIGLGRAVWENCTDEGKRSVAERRMKKYKESLRQRTPCYERCDNCRELSNSRFTYFCSVCGLVCDTCVVGCRTSHPSCIRQ